MYFTGSSRFDDVIRGLLSTPCSRSGEPKIDKQDSKNCVRGLSPAIQPAAAPFVNFLGPPIKLCRIKGKIKGGRGVRTTSLALVRTGNAELDHPRLKSCPFHAKPGGRTRGAADYPIRFA
jgi:hypothetical protein